MVRHIQIDRKILHFYQPFKLAYEAVRVAEVIILKISDHEGHYGLGSASVDTEVTGEKFNEVFRVLKQKLNREFFTYPFDQWYLYHEKIQRHFKNYPAAQAVVEGAILDLLSKKYNVPLTRIFGGFREFCEISITIGIKGKHATVQEAKKRISEGFRVVKLKCGLNVKDDIENIRAVKKVLPRGGKLLVDANQGYSLPQAKQLVRSLKGLGVCVLEQPLKAKNLNGLKKLNKLSPITIMADESASNMNEAIYLLTRNYVGGLNLKLMKFGGPINCMKIFHLAKSLNKTVMLGCMYESNISITAAAHLALALPFDYVDLDSGHNDFKDDPVVGGARVRDGKITIQGPLVLKRGATVKR